MKYYIKPCS